jgi:glyoxylase-like metal-dependent hydrolase (beta-lactamase superfamily II)
MNVQRFRTDVMSELLFPHREHPAPGKTHEVAPGVYWLSMPMGGSLNHINLYVLDDRDGWYIVDTGLPNDEVRDLWHELFSSAMGGRPVKGVICTHMHPDHTGQAGMLTDHFRCPLYMTQLEFLHARMMTGSAGPPFGSWQGMEHYRRAGMNADWLERMRQMFETMMQSRTPPSAGERPVGPRFGIQLPSSYQRLRDGDTLTIGGEEWRIVVGSGHSPEHACLYCRRLGVLLSGDQILPIITSNVSVQPTEPDANPLAAWMDSHIRFMNLPAETFVLPAHNLPFHGLRTRLSALIHHHEDRMLACEEHCLEPRTAVELLPVLFRRELDERQTMMALGEAIAHLNLLQQRHRIERTLHEDGVYRYRSIDPLLPRRLDPRQHDLPDEAPDMV